MRARSEERQEGREGGKRGGGERLDDSEGRVIEGTGEEKKGREEEV